MRNIEIKILCASCTSFTLQSGLNHICGNPDSPNYGALVKYTDVCNNWKSDRQNTAEGSCTAMNNDRISSCKACRAAIKFVKTMNGKSMPVDCNKVDFYPSPDGNDIGYYDERTQTAAGFVNLHTYGYYLDKPCEGSEKVYKPHWATCSRPDKFRKAATPKKKPPPAKPAPPPMYEQMSLI